MSDSSLRASTLLCALGHWRRAAHAAKLRVLAAVPAPPREAALERPTAKIEDDAVKRDVGHRVGGVPQDDAGCEERLDDAHAAERHGVEANAALRRACVREGVGERALVAERRVRLLLLLRPDPHRPPPRLRDEHIFIRDVLDERCQSKEDGSGGSNTAREQRSGAEAPVARSIASVADRSC
jgi:hypothetical protein